MKAGKILASLAVIASVVISHGVQANTYSLGLLSSTPTSLYVSVPPGDVNDRFDFSIGTLSDASAVATNQRLSLYSLDILNITNLSLSLYNSTDALINGPSASGQSLTSPNLAVGSYYAKVTGNANGLSGGGYSIALVAFPVPVPAAVWLLGSGLIGLVGVSRRKAA